MRYPRYIAVACAAAALLTAPVSAIAAGDADGGSDFGATVERLLHDKSSKLFGFRHPLEAPADAGTVVARELATAGERQFLADGLGAEFVARNVAQLGDMIAFWPDDIDYTHLVVCIEQGRSPGGAGFGTGRNAAVQRVDVRTGEVETILFGMSRCDGIRTTPWGTVLATEETGDGRGYEIIDPLGTTGHWVFDRAAGDIRTAVDGAVTSAAVVQRQALPTMRWEGLAVLPSGAVLGGDELRPGDAAPDADGGAMYKFVPDIPRDPDDSTPILDLAQSPLAAGQVFAMSISCQPQGSGGDRFPQFGQGCEIGQGAWVKVNALSAPDDANARGATGYYRPEDLHADPAFEGEGVRFCWNNTGNSGAGNFAETVCAVDPTPVPADPIVVEHPRGDRVDSRDGTPLEYLADATVLASADQVSDAFATVVANRFVEGDPRFNSSDNLAFQPVTGNLYVIEDHSFGEVYACLPDGADRDIKTDGCVAMLSVRDPNAEPTGFVFDGTGRTAFYIVQHGQQPDSLLDFASNPLDGRTDDLIRITGFRVDSGRTR